MEIYEYIVIIVTAILIIMAGILLVQHVDLNSKSYTIQDIYVYCCEHPEIEITSQGDNCTNVINNVYGGRC